MWLFHMFNQSFSFNVHLPTSKCISKGPKTSIVIGNNIVGGHVYMDEKEINCAQLDTTSRHSYGISLEKNDSNP